ncbi:MAG TPA: sigma-70 family RNA polymerase sigma factor [Verrucomicrobiae bacterium]|jgi:RNA polymerase sigma factor (sigma-70 family)
MPDANDMDLIRQFARDNSEAAFTELVRRHINLVYSVARRCTGNDGDAHDVTQAVFIILARKAAGLREKTLLTGWLYETTRFAAARLLRTNARRHAREQEAYMQSTLNEADTAAIWEKLSPHLETAMGKLNAADRTLLVLRFYENKSGPEAAALLGIREDAAHKRVTRALEKLRKVFMKRGVTLTAAAIAGAVSANSVQAAPAGLAAIISTTALSGTTITTAAVLAVTKAIAMTTLQKAIITTALVATVGAGVFEAHQNSQLREQNQTLQQQQASLTEPLAQLQRERNDANNQLSSLEAEIEKLKSYSSEDELLRLRGEVARLKTAEAQSENDPIEAAAKAWGQKASRLKLWVEQTPGQSIPELLLLSTESWMNGILGSPNWVESTNNYAFFAGVLRTAAKARLAEIMVPALGDYIVANNGQLPDNPSELKPYLNTYLNAPNRQTSDSVIEIPDTMLQDYEMLHTGNVSSLSQSEPLIIEKSPIQNAQYDALFKIGAFGYSHAGVSPNGMSMSVPEGSRYADGRLEKLFKDQ